MIIVEGPDGSGKTELIKRLGYERWSMKSLRAGVGGVGVNGTQGWADREDQMPFDAYQQKVSRALRLEASEYGTRIAFDRFHLSERVYGPILRGAQLIDDENLYSISSLLRAKQIPVILCLPPFHVTDQNVHQSGRERPAYQTLRFLSEAYMRFQDLQPWATVVYDYTRDPLPTFGGISQTSAA